MDNFTGIFVLFISHVIIPDFILMKFFYQIESDIISLKGQYDVPSCLFGDFNAHTKTSNDFIELDDMIPKLTGCDILNEENYVKCSDLNEELTTYIYNQDTLKINRNGKHLLSLCQALNFRIVKGRLGSDKYHGSPTCHKGGASVVVSENVIPHLCDFHVEMFDSCSSDVHSPVEFVLSCDVSLPPTENVSCNVRPVDRVKEVMKTTECGNDNPSNLPKMHFQWSAQLAQDFNDALSNRDLENLIEQLNILSNDVTQCSIGNLCLYLNEILLSTAKNVGVYRETTEKTRKIKLKPQCPPWFGHECPEKRRLYYRAKNIN